MRYVFRIELEHVAFFVSGLFWLSPTLRGFLCYWVPVQTEARLHKAEAATLTVMVMGTALFLGAAFVCSVNNAEAMGLDVSDEIKEMREWVNQQS